jgi:hypothetical protein
MATFSGEKSWHWKGGDAIPSYPVRLLRATVGRGVTDSEWRAIKLRFDNRCACCRRPASERRLTMDHIVPLSKGGSHQPENIQPLCLLCNQVKHVRILAFNQVGGGVELKDVGAFLRSIIAGTTPVEAIGLNLKFLDQLAQQEQGALAIAGIEAYDASGAR